MSPSKTKKNTRSYSYTCSTCDSSYIGRREQADKTKRFCKDSCRKARSRQPDKAAKRQSRIEDQFIRFCKSSFGQWVIRECIKASTVCIMMTHTTASLFELEQFHNRYYKCYGFNPDERKSVYHRCHIQARIGIDGSVGALHPLNLFIGQWRPNQQAGNKLVSTDAGLSIPAHKLLKKWQVGVGDVAKQVAKKVRALLDEEFAEYLAQSSALKLDTLHTLARQIYNRQQKSTAVRELEDRYTLGQLEQLPLEQLELMDAHQRGKDSFTRFASDKHTRAALCVYADELGRMAAVSPSQRHRDNCTFVLGLVQVLGIYIAQRECPVYGDHKTFLPQEGFEWQPLTYMNWQQPWGKPNRKLIDADHRLLIGSITEHCYNALSGADIPKGLLRARLLKRLDVATLAPTVLVPDGQRFKQMRTWPAYIAALSANAELVWRPLLALDLCTPQQVEAARTGLLDCLHTAIDNGRRAYLAQPRFSRFHRGRHYNRWGFKGYPAHLEFPPVAAEPLPVAA
ncbi:hypothetical protein Q6A49_01400 [Pseudomonas sp. 22-AL-CL-001]|uniref:hypothetical protein n=1 Tax=Pseudomonas alabamensis TaxID=3064349 RepID=UPI00271242BD|nr:hypothetical protein [Pseudomonas sp. 22-AL-CL-001]MDO7909189.1 hypothetical protein [Pseudomonas sp. 22-AL-CL-001]